MSLQAIVYPLAGTIPFLVGPKRIMSVWLVLLWKSALPVLHSIFLSFHPLNVSLTVNQ